jgi:ankyrin repeat protein
VKAKDARGRTALLAATHGNHVAAARALIAAGADVNAKDDIEDSPTSMPAPRAAPRS